MKTYSNEQEFVLNFAKDCKQGIKSNGNFEAEVNNAVIVVSGMDNNNVSKVTIYTATINGVAFSGSITALKKRLNVTYTKEYNRSTESSTKVTIKSDEELKKTAETATKRITEALNVLKQASQRYSLSRADMMERTESIEGLILDSLKRQRDRVAKERADKEAQQAREAAQRETKKQQLLEALSAASAKGNMSEIMRLSKELKSYM